MTAEELDEVIEKAVKAFEKIESSRPSWPNVWSNRES